MRILLPILTIFACLSFAGLGVSYKEAIEGNKKNGKPILLEFYADWCIPCLEMEKIVFKDPAVIKELKNNFNFVRLNTEKQEQIFCEGETLPILDCVELWEIQGIPTFALLDKDGSLRHITTGTFEKKTFLNFLKVIRKK
ncbi:MAG: thioredoxin family protein [Fibromonadaceae bacterium]|jgi:thiol:disulfide interchange protein|nr:thioredoxin family protein [Fibromonadaceae bacterium]